MFHIIIIPQQALLYSFITRLSPEINLAYLIILLRIGARNIYLICRVVCGYLTSSCPIAFARQISQRSSLNCFHRLCFWCYIWDMKAFGYKKMEMMVETIFWTCIRVKSHCLARAQRSGWRSCRNLMTFYSVTDIVRKYVFERISMSAIYIYIHNMIFLKCGKLTSY